MEKRKKFLSVIFQSGIIATVCYLINSFPSTGYGGILELRIKYYGSPVLVVACITLLLTVLQYLKILYIKVGRKERVAVSIVLIFIAIYYFLVINSQIGPFICLSSMISDSYRRYSVITGFYKDIFGTIFISIYGILLYFAVSKA
ncbi:MAG: hypothetical protein ACLUFH_00515 [Monoglobales bacterium]